VEPPEIEIFTVPEVWEDVSNKIIVSYYKDYPHFFYINFPHAGWCIPLPIEYLDRIEKIIKLIRALRKKQDPS